MLAATIYDRSTDATRSINSNVMMLTFDASGMLGPLLGGAVIHAGFGYQGVFMAAAFMVLCSGGFMVLDRLRLALWDRREQQRRRSPGASCFIRRRETLRRPLTTQKTTRHTGGFCFAL